MDDVRNRARLKVRVSLRKRPCEPVMEDRGRVGNRACWSHGDPDDCSSGMCFPAATCACFRDVHELVLVSLTW